MAHRSRPCRRANTVTPRGFTARLVPLLVGFLTLPHSVTLLGCGAGEQRVSPAGGPCASNRDCRQGTLCVAGTCAEPSPKDCTNDETCGIGEHCGETSHRCEPDDGQPPMGCTSDASCPPRQKCNTLTGACLDGTGSDPNPNPNPNPNPGPACSSDASCAPPLTVCSASECVPGCAQRGGLSCSSGTVCDSSTGRCIAHTGSCMSDAECGPPTSVCELSQCVPGCGRVGGVQCSGNTVCDSGSGRCTAGGSFCASDLECSPPSTICKLQTGDCDPGCATAGCGSGDACDTTSGHCMSSQGCRTDAFEENDSHAQAGGIGAGTHSGLSVCPMDDDYYLLTLDAGEALSLDVAFQSADGNVDVEILDASGAVIASGRGSGSGEQVTFTPASPGTFSIRVFLVSDLGPTAGCPYSMAIAVAAAPCGQDNFEDNDAASTPSSVGPGSISGLNLCTGDDDHYAVSLTSGDQITVTLTFDTSEGDIDLQLLNPLGVGVASSGGVSGTESITHTANLTGAYVVRAYLFSDTGSTQGNAYAMGITTTTNPNPMPSACGDNLEENDSAAAATPISAGSFSSLTICTGDDDFYAVSLSAGQNVAINLAFMHSEGDIDLTLLDPSGAVVASSGSVTNAESISYNATVAGTFTARIYLFADPGNTPGNAYSMTMQLSSAPPPCSTDTFEPNNSQQAASPMAMTSYPGLNVCPMDDDYYGITLAVNDVVLIDLLFTHSQGDVDLTLLDGNGSVVARSVSTSDNESLTYTVPAAGTYTVRVYLFSDLGSSPGNTYDLMLSR